jgi:hypothetical protein
LSLGHVDIFEHLKLFIAFAQPAVKNFEKTSTPASNGNKWGPQVYKTVLHTYDREGSNFGHSIPRVAFLAFTKSEQIPKEE